jgi:hypothetical protein
MLYVTIPVFQSFSPKDLDVLTATAVFLIGSSINLMFECQFLLIHLSYYIIAYYMELLSLHLGDVDDELLVTLNKEYNKSGIVCKCLCFHNKYLKSITGKRRTRNVAPWYSSIFAKLRLNWIEFYQFRSYLFWPPNSSRSSPALLLAFWVWFIPTKCWTISFWCSLFFSSPIGSECWSFYQQLICLFAR